MFGIFSLNRAVIIVLASMFVVASACALDHVNGAASDASGSHLDKSDLQNIELERRNWESHGTDVRISSNGEYEVFAFTFGERELLRKGEIKQSEMEELLHLVEKVEADDLHGEYKAPFKSEFSWWGYQLTIRNKQGERVIRFHSENDTVPSVLVELVERVMQSAR